VRVVYQDAELIVVDKPAGLPVTPSARSGRGSVLSALAELDLGQVFPVHLLDREASGLVLLSRSPAAAQALRWNWRSGLCERQYVAVLTGEVIGTEGRIRLPIGAVATRAGKRHEVVPRELGGRSAATQWQLLARKSGLSRVLVTVTSARTHQLRVHFAAVGHPIVGDRPRREVDTAVPLSALVESPAWAEAVALPKHQIALHSWRIALPHPRTNQPVEWQAPLPTALTRLMPGPWSTTPVALRAPVR
jgi:RluA family pseudouridine synthase